MRSLSLLHAVHSSFPRRSFSIASRWRRVMMRGCGPLMRGSLCVGGQIS
jgi:hypothetical protein